MNLSQAKWLRSLLCTLFLSLLAPMALAQTITVKGVVTDATHNEPVIGATVMLVEDASKGMLTNLDANLHSRLSPLTDTSGSPTLDIRP